MGEDRKRECKNSMEHGNSSNLCYLMVKCLCCFLMLTGLIDLLCMLSDLLLLTVGEDQTRGDERERERERERGGDRKIERM